VFGLDLKAIRSKRRVSTDNKYRRDMLIYFLWETGKLSNQVIANLIRLTYSSVSRRVSLFKESMKQDRVLETNYQLAKSQIKV